MAIHVEEISFDPTYRFHIEPREMIAILHNPSFVTSIKDDIGQVGGVMHCKIPYHKEPHIEVVIDKDHVSDSIFDEIIHVINKRINGG